MNKSARATQLKRYLGVWGGLVAHLTVINILSSDTGQSNTSEAVQAGARKAALRHLPLEGRIAELRAGLYIQSAVPAPASMFRAPYLYQLARLKRRTNYYRESRRATHRKRVRLQEPQCEPNGVPGPACRIKARYVYPNPPCFSQSGFAPGRQAQAHQEGRHVASCRSEWDKKKERRLPHHDSLVRDFHPEAFDPG